MCPNTMLWDLSMSNPDWKVLLEKTVEKDSIMHASQRRCGCGPSLSNFIDF